MKDSKIRIEERRKHGWWSDVYNHSFRMLSLKAYKRRMTTLTEDDETASLMSASLCPVCNKVWEPDHVSNPRKLTIHYHDDFPTFKIPRNTCIQCKKGGSNGARDED
jgi:hypothetical protein